MKNLLVVTGYFPPSSEVGTQRALRLVRGIREFGWEPYVLTMPAKCMRPLDFNIGKDVISSTDIERVPCWSIWQHSSWWRRTKPGISRTVAMAFRAFAKISEPLIPLDEFYPWAIAATRRGVSMVKRYHIDLIWSTSPKPSYLYLAKRIFKKTGIPYVADFRDVQKLGTDQDISRRERRAVEIERQILRDAAGLTYAAPAQINVLCEKHAFVRDMRSKLIYNWFEASEATVFPPRQFHCATILHGGNLYGGHRRLDGFLDGLSKLVKRAAATNARLQFLQFGHEPDMRFLTRGLNVRGLTEAATVSDSLPRNEFMSACRGADILLVVVGRDKGSEQHANAVPGKLYDYFAACRPILVIGPPGCEAGKMVTRLNRGLAVSDNAPESIAEAIEQLLKGVGNKGKLDLSLEAVKEFEASVTLKKMAGFFSQVLS